METSSVLSWRLFAFLVHLTWNLDNSGRNLNGGPITLFPAFLLQIPKGVFGLFCASGD